LAAAAAGKTLSNRPPKMSQHYHPSTINENESSTLSESISKLNIVVNTPTKLMSGRTTTTRKKLHDNEYNHDMEKHLQAKHNESDFIPHDSFLKKFSTRTQQQQMTLNQSHISLVTSSGASESHGEHHHHHHKLIHYPVL
jgi:hypothetical protein